MARITDLPTELLDQIIDCLDGSYLIHLLLTCKVLSRLALVRLRSTLVYKGDNTSLRHGLATIAIKLFSDPGLCASIKSVTLAQWGRSGTFYPFPKSQREEDRWKWPREAFAMSFQVIEEQQLNIELIAAITSFELKNEERLILLLLQCLPNITCLNLEPRPVAIFPGVSFHDEIQRYACQSKRPILQKLQEISWTGKSPLYRHDISCLFPYFSWPSLECIHISRARGTGHAYKTVELVRPSNLRRLVIGDPHATILDEINGQEGTNVQPGALQALLEHSPKLEVLEYYHNSQNEQTRYSWNVLPGDSEFVHPYQLREAISVAKKSLKKLVVTNTDPEWIWWNSKPQGRLIARMNRPLMIEEHRIGSFKAFECLTQLDIQLLLLGKLPEDGSTMTLNLHEVLPKSLEYLTLLECSRPELFAQTSIEGRDVIHMVDVRRTIWREDDFISEMRLLAKNKNEFLPNLKKISLGDAEWTDGNVVPHIQQIFDDLSTGVIVQDDRKFRSWRMGKVVYHTFC